MKELKECPFCGGEVDWCKNDMDFHKPDDDCHYINCERCGEFSLNMIDSAEFPKVYDSLADQWNTRASVEVSKLEEIMDRCDKTAREAWTIEDYMGGYGDIVCSIDKLIDKANNG